MEKTSSHPITARVARLRAFFDDVLEFEHFLGPIDERLVRVRDLHEVQNFSRVSSKSPLFDSFAQIIYLKLQAIKKAASK